MALETLAWALVEARRFGHLLGVSPFSSLKPAPGIIWCQPYGIGYQSSLTAVPDT
jgi:hypothetical protein